MFLQYYIRQRLLEVEAELFLMSLVERAALRAQGEQKRERERKWCVAMVIRFTEQVSVLQRLEAA